ncbi:MAG: hypothetical protein CMF51_02305 [Legionellales bacterium]|nr:hypothetical protein [Legionellales bacterium]
MVISTFETFKQRLQNFRPQLKHLYISPCSSVKDTFSACALLLDSSGKLEVLFYEDSCLAGCFRREEEVNLADELKKVRQKHSIFYTHFGGEDIKDVPGAFTVQTSITKSRNTAVAANAHFLPNGHVLIFGPCHCIHDAQALLLQRTGFRGAKTFDVELLNGDSQKSFELRLVKNSHLNDLQEWGTTNNMIVFRSSEIIASSLLFRAYRESLEDGKTSEEAWIAIAKALEGEDSDAEYEENGYDSDEWVPEDDDDSSESDESMGEDDEEDLLECLRD